MAIRNTVKLKKYLDIVEEFQRGPSEIKPGHLVDINSDGKAIPHGAADGNALAMFALEDELQGNTVNDAYAEEDDPVQVWVPNRGEIVYAIVADAEDPAVGAYVSSNGDGTLKTYGSPATADDNNVIVGQVIESKNTEDYDDHRVKVRIL